MIVASRGVSPLSAFRSWSAISSAVDQLAGLAGASTSSIRSPMLVSPSSPIVESKADRLPAGTQGSSIWSGVRSSSTASSSGVG